MKNYTEQEIARLQESLQLIRQSGGWTAEEFGDSFRILEIDGDAVLIEKIGDKQNPYFVSGKFLASISDYKN